MTNMKDTFGKNAKRKIFESSYKYSDALANLFGATLVLSFGFLIFAIFVTLLEAYIDWKWTTLYVGEFVLASAIIMAVSAMLMFYFAKRVPTFDRHSIRMQHKDVKYVLSKWSIETLKAAGVAEDIIEFLQSLVRQNKTEDELTLKMYPKEYPMDNWMVKLKNELGDERVNEFEGAIFKYTRRPQSWQKDNTVRHSPKDNDRGHSY